MHLLTSHLAVVLAQCVYGLDLDLGLGLGLGLFSHSEEQSCFRSWRGNLQTTAQHRDSMIRTPFPSHGMMG